MSEHLPLKMATTPEEQRGWMNQWRYAAVALEEQKTAESTQPDGGPGG